MFSLPLSFTSMRNYESHAFGNYANFPMTHSEPLTLKVVWVIIAHALCAKALRRSKASATGIATGNIFWYSKICIITDFGTDKISSYSICHSFVHKVLRIVTRLCKLETSRTFAIMKCEEIWTIKEKLRLEKFIYSSFSNFPIFPSWALLWT